MAGMKDKFAVQQCIQLNRMRGNFPGKSCPNRQWYFPEKGEGEQEGVSRGNPAVVFLSLAKLREDA